MVLNFDRDAEQFDGDEQPPRSAVRESGASFALAGVRMLVGVITAGCLSLIYSFGGASSWMRFHQPDQRSLSTSLVCGSSV